MDNKVMAADPMCFNCEQPGHIARSCPAIPIRSRCTGCGKIRGHSNMCRAHMASDPTTPIFRLKFEAPAPKRITIHTKDQRYEQNFEDKVWVVDGYTVKVVNEQLMLFGKVGRLQLKLIHPTLGGVNFIISNDEVRIPKRYILVDKFFCVLANHDSGYGEKDAPKNSTSTITSEIEIEGQILQDAALKMQFKGITLHLKTSTNPDGKVDVIATPNHEHKFKQKSALEENLVKPSVREARLVNYDIDEDMNEVMDIPELAPPLKPINAVIRDESLFQELVREMKEVL